MDAERLDELNKQLRKAQKECWDAHTNIICQYLDEKDEASDEVVKTLLDERRMVFNEFAARMTED